MRLRELTEGVGRITKQNQTVDVGPDEIKTQAKKFGNSVDRDGRPPTLSKKVKGKSTNVLFNLGLAEDKMGAINIDTALENTPEEWSEWIRTLPTELAQEFIDERPNPDQEDIDVYTKLRLTSKTPVEVSAKALLNEPWMKGSISRTPQPVVDAINKRYGTEFKSGTVYDRNPDRFFKYAEMPAATAKPSVMVNGDVIFGVGRMIAALLRGDSKIKVWDLKG